MIQAKLADGRVLQFPDGTDQRIIQGKVKELMGQQPAQETELQKKYRLIGEQIAQEEDPAQRLAREESEGFGGFLKTGAISTGRGLYKIGRALGLVDPESDAEAQAFKALEKERPVTTFLGEAVGESLPFAAVPVGAIGGTAARVAAGSGLGVLEGILIAKGEGRQLGDQLKAGTVGGTLAGLSEILVPHIGRLGNKIFRKVMKRAPKGALITPKGDPTDELLTALKNSGLEYKDVVDGAMGMLNQPSNLTPDQAVRKAFLEGQGFVGDKSPTLPQITRDATDFQMQQEARKTANKVRGRLEAQEGLLTNRFDEAITGTGGNPVSSGSPVHDFIQNKSTVLDNQIGELYDVAGSRLQTGEMVNLTDTFKKLKQMRPSDTLMGGMVKAVEGEAARLGLIGPKGGVLRNATVEEAELLRKFTNKIYKSVNDFGRGGIKEIKDGIDFGVTKAAGEDIYKVARKAKFDFERGLDTERIGKFSKRKVHVVREMLEDKITAENMFDRVVLGKRVEARDIKALKGYLISGTPGQKVAGKKAFNDLRAETAEWIRGKAFTGPEDAAGNQAMNVKNLETAINKIGGNKMHEIFDTQELKFFNDMIKVGKIRQPVSGTALGKGPSSQGITTAIDSLKRRIDKIPVLNAFVDMELDMTSGGILKARPRVIDKQRGLPIVPLSQAAGVGGAATVLPRSEDNGTNN